MITTNSNQLIDNFFNDITRFNSRSLTDSLYRSFKANDSYIEISGVLPKMDIIDHSGERVEIIFDVHGYDKDSLNLKINEAESKLTLSTGKLKPYSKEEGSNQRFIVNELKKSSSQRVIIFPDQLDLTSVTSKYEDGYLICTIQYGSGKENERQLLIT